jgi:hypothetical protein
MKADNKRNIHYFEATTMEKLCAKLEDWQDAHQKRFLSTNVQLDGRKFCCIALTNPTEIVITDKTGSNYARVTARGNLVVYDCNP